MPPKTRFCQADIIAAALEIMQETGKDHFTARDIASWLKCSTQPIFSYFENMAELNEMVLAEGWRRFDEYLGEADKYEPAFKMRGMLMVKYAKEHPAIFRYIFFNKKRECSLDEYLKHHLVGFQRDIDTMKVRYELSEEQAYFLFKHNWMTGFSICMLCVGDVCEFSEEEISIMLSESFMSYMLYLKTPNHPIPSFTPSIKNTEDGKRYAKSIMTEMSIHKK